MSTEPIDVDAMKMVEFLLENQLEVFELFGTRGGVCLCRKGVACESPGKHPTAAKWQGRAKQVPDAGHFFLDMRKAGMNYGIKTSSNLAVMDFDGAEGLATLSYLEQGLPELQKLPRVCTQSGGVHLYYRRDAIAQGELRNSTRRLPGMDVRGEGGYVVGPGSVGALGRYTLVSAGPSIAMLGAEVERKLLVLSSQKSLKLPRSRVGKGNRNQNVFQSLCRARARSVSGADLKSYAFALNAWNDPPLDDAEVASILENVERYDTGKVKGRAIDDRSARGRSDEVLPLLVDQIGESNATGRWLGYNQFTREIEVLKPAPYSFPKDDVFPRALSEIDIASVRDFYTRALGKNVSADNAFAALRLVAADACFHPVRDYLRGLAWDGKPRVERFFSAFFGAEDSQYTSLAARCFLISMVARIFAPGAKVDTVIVLEGAQGIGKSEGLRALAAPYFGDPALDFSNKDAVLQCTGLWLVELAELVALQNRGSSGAKAFISTRVDRIRPPYGRVVEQIPRQFVLVGTTNEDKYLHDSTGNRRFLPLKVTNVDVQAIADSRDQIFAEATSMYEAGVAWWPSSPSDVQICAVEQGDRLERHPWADLLSNFFESRADWTEFYATDLFAFLGIPSSQCDKSKQTTLGQIMRDFGFKRVRVGKERATAYSRDVTHLRTFPPHSMDSAKEPLVSPSAVQREFQQIGSQCVHVGDPPSPCDDWVDAKKDQKGCAQGPEGTDVARDALWGARR